jgi:hypothetical protein
MWLYACLFFVLLCPRVLCQNLSLRLSFGLNNGGTINDSSGERRIDNSYDISAEMLVKLTSHFYLGIGTGHKSLSVVNGVLVYDLSEWHQFYNMQPTARLNVVPLFASIVLQGNLIPWARVYLTGGFGIYFGYINAEAEWRIQTGPIAIFQRQSKYRTDTQTLAYHVGSGIDISLGEVFSIFIQALYNPVAFTNIDVMEEQTQTGLNPIISETGEHVFPSDYVYKISEISFSGLSLNVGIRVVF